MFSTLELTMGPFKDRDQAGRQRMLRKHCRQARDDRLADR